MSLLDKGNSDIIVFPEEVVIDRDGNTRTRASSTGVAAKAWLNPQGQSGTAARRAEQDKEGFETETVLRMRLSRQDEIKLGELGAQSKIEFQGEAYSVFGDPKRFYGSPRVAHNEYILRRA